MGALAGKAERGESAYAVRLGRGGEQGVAEGVDFGDDERFNVGI